jgi:hypothetical protein
MVFRQLRRNSLISRLAAIDLAEYRPCFQFAFLDRSRPSGVRGPVDLPPCILHLPFGIAGDLHGVPFLVLAPHLGPFIRLFFAQGLFIGFFAPPLVDHTNYCLSTLINMNVLDNHFLLTSGSVLL